LSCRPLLLARALPYRRLICTATRTTFLYTLSLHDALPIYIWTSLGMPRKPLTSLGLTGFCYQEVAIVASVFCLMISLRFWIVSRSEEHTSELQSRENLVCRLLLEKKNLCRTPNTHAPSREV